MADLEALALRCEAASDQDGTLDAEIHIAIGLAEGNPVATPLGWCVGSKRNPNPVRSPSYTFSIDAAMTLVPEGSLFTARTVWDNMKPAGLGFVSRYEKGEFGGHERLYWMDEHQSVAATPALALCAAALRARASVDRNPEGEKPQALSAQHESAVPEADAQTPPEGPSS